MKALKRRLVFVRFSASVVLGLALLGCGAPKNFKKFSAKYSVEKTPRLTAPPAGRALVNFHRPSKSGTGLTVPVFLGTGTLLCNLPQGSGFQQVFAPGENVFISLNPIQVEVIKANLAGDRIYDIMIDFRFGQGDQIVPLLKGDPRRSRLSEFEARETNVQMVRDAANERFEREHQSQIEEIKRDYFAGSKQSGVIVLGPNDCR